MENDDFQRKTDTEIRVLLPDLQPGEKCEALRLLSDRAMRRGDHAQSASFAAEAAQIAVGAADDHLAAGLFTAQASAVCRGGDCEEAIALYERAVTHYERAAAGRESGQAWSSIAACAIDTGDYDKAFDAGVRARDIGIAVEDYLLAGWGAFRAAKSMYFDDLERESVGMLAQARDAFRKHGDVTQAALVDDFTAKVHDILDEREEALELLSHCLRIADTLGSERDIAYARRRFGEQLARVYRHEEALVHLSRARETYVAHRHFSDIARIDRVIADSLSFLDRHDEAIEAYERAQALYEGFGDDGAANVCRRQRAVLLAMGGRAGEAETLYRQILALAARQEGLHHLGYIFRVTLELCDLLIRRDELGEVLELTEQVPGSADDQHPANLIWRHALRARARFSRQEWDHALHEAEHGISRVTPALSKEEVAYLYEIRALIGLGRGVDTAERDLMRAIAIHLTSGLHQRATELATHFLPAASDAD